MEPKHAWEEKINKTFIRVRQPQESPLMIGMDYAHIIQNRLLYNSRRRPPGSGWSSQFAVYFVYKAAFLY